MAVEPEEEKMEEKIEGLDDDEQTTLISLRCNDGKAIEVEKGVAMMSDLIKNSLDDKAAKEIEMLHVDSNVIGLVVEYMKYHKTVPPKEITPPLSSTNMADVVDAFDAKFVDNLDQTTMFRLLLAANYMGVKPLVTLICAKIATLVKGKTPQMIRKTFGIRDFTPEEEKEVKRDFPDLIE